MSWNTISVSDVLDELSPQEAAAFNTIQGQSTSQANILARVVNEVRDYIAAGNRPLDAANTIPDQLRNQVIDLTLWRWLKKFPALKNLQTEPRKAAYDAAMELLKELAKKDSDIYIALPSGTSTTAPAPVTLPAVGEKRHRFGPRHEDGI